MILSAKMETCRKSELSGENRGECVYYWFSGKEEVHAEEGMMPLEQSSLRQLKIGLQHEAVSEVM